MRQLLLLFRLLMMTSSIASSLAPSVTLGDGCMSLPADTCIKPTIVAGKFACSNSILVLAPGAAAGSIDAACLEVCDKYFRRLSISKCPTGVDSPCGKLAGDTKQQGLTCADLTRTLVPVVPRFVVTSLLCNLFSVNGVPIKYEVVCHPPKGWFDFQGGKYAIDVEQITGHPVFEYYCHSNCENFSSDCNGVNCLQPTLINDVLKCPYGNASHLVYNNEFYDRVKCSKAEWRAYISSSDETGIQLINFKEDQLAKLRINCHDTGLSIRAHPISAKMVENTNYKGEVQCSSYGWTHIDTAKRLVNYTLHADQNIRVMCLPYCDNSRVEDACPPGVCIAKPKIENNKLTCEAGHYLIIENVEYSEVKCAAGVWTTSQNPPNLRIDNSENFEKIKAKCHSKCHLDYILTNCTEPCSKPLYLGDEGKLICRNPDEVLHFNDKITSSYLKCDKLTGWSNAEGTIFAFTNTATTVTAFCRSTSKVAAKSEEKQISRTTLSTIVGSASFVVGIGLGVGIGLLICHIRKRKRGNSGSNKESFTKSGKTTSGKKGKKGKKSKTPKKSEKKKERPNDTVMMPGHQMSQFTSGNLTNVVAANTPPNNKNAHIPPNTPDAQTPPTPIEIQAQITNPINVPTPPDNMAGPSPPNPMDNVSPNGTDVQNPLNPLDLQV